MAYSAVSIANAFLQLARDQDSNIDPMKIQKLCYLVHGYYLVEHNGEPLLDENFEAWTFGPVLPSLYHAAKEFGRGPIDKYLRDYDFRARCYVRAKPPADHEIVEIIEFVWETYGSMRAMELSDWTHEKGGPWDRVINSEEDVVRNPDIPNEMIREYFIRTMYDAVPPEA